MAFVATHNGCVHEPMEENEEVVFDLYNKNMDMRKYVVKIENTMFYHIFSRQIVNLTHNI